MVRLCLDAAPARRTSDAVIQICATTVGYCRLDSFNRVFGHSAFIEYPYVCTCIKLMKGKALRKHSLHEKTAASVLLKPFICSNEWCHTTDAPWRMSGTRFSNVNNIHVHSMIPEDQKNMTTQWCSSYGPAWRTLDVVMWWSICTTMARSCGFNRSSLRSIICQNIYSCISLPMQ